MDKIYYYIIAVNILLGFKLFWDWRARTKEKRIINHSRSLWIDITIYSAVSIGLYGVSGFGFGLVVLATLYRGLFFDLLYNLIFNRKWTYCGDSSKIDEWSDKLDGSDDQECLAGFIMKVILIAVVITLMILL